MTEVDPRDVLRQRILTYGSQKKAAHALRVGESYLSDMVSGRRLVSERVLRKLGLRRVVVSAS